ncbi:MAG TPA: thiol-disulfide oxidoreductase DCC family protein [Puia sp.]|jgi:predicted DCC family thiol-disulfide oxidoreductase YuxK|nr:thiol-disulfide oxidoreductase DCC family protein [Puia sp.]
MNKEKKIVLFDGVCNLCSRGIQFIIKHDKKNQFLFSSLQGKTGQGYLKQFNLPVNDINSFILIESNKLFTRSTAALRILKYLGNGWQLFYAFIIFPKFMRDGVYKLIAKNRYKWFGKKEACWIPTPELQSKFLD